MIEGFYDELGNPNSKMYCILDTSEFGGPSFKAY